jgi:hypothetical protein
VNEWKFSWALGVMIWEVLKSLSRNEFRDLGVDGREKYQTLSERNMVWQCTRYIWLRTGASGSFVWTRKTEVRGSVLAEKKTKRIWQEETKIHIKCNFWRNTS